jgi:hypothetical protein
MDMLLGIWVIFFIVGLVPSSIFGYLLVKLPLGFGWQVLLSACLAALSGYVISLVVVPAEAATTDIHARNIALFAPPILLATLVSIYWTRKEPKPPPRS